MRPNLDDESRAELLCDLVVAQLVARARTGGWLRSDHFVESLNIWLNANSAQADWLERMYVKFLSETLALDHANSPHLADESQLARLFTDGWRLDYTSQVVEGIHKLCADALRYR
ncbi:hypothetical protein CUJ91_04650 [Paraburkholderia graminis]|uniref:hypothetical protein n=1 Tax=Paraburkholderia graminis TaxID=60548 RepID=UPI000DEF5C3A|nr:hypothetical protein [Paraburkholderia graminis]AXF07287.1 hypothetical protein CUJ91_04650 [Paraburkholderia graminis]